MSYPDPQQPQPQMVMTMRGPNHVLHLILSVFTFYFFGGWLWVWLIIAMINKQTPVWTNQVTGRQQRQSGPEPDVRFPWLDRHIQGPGRRP